MKLPQRYWLYIVCTTVFVEQPLALPGSANSKCSQENVQIRTTQSYFCNHWIKGMLYEKKSVKPFNEKYKNVEMLKYISDFLYDALSIFFSFI